MNNVKPAFNMNPGSFRDPDNRVYEYFSSKNNRRILRGLSKNALSTYISLSELSFYQEFLTAKDVVNTTLLSHDEKEVKVIMADGWAGVIEHDPIPFITYPYEWTFSMLKQAALLQLELIEKSLENGWTMKDATPYNIQWIGSKPIFY